MSLDVYLHTEQVLLTMPLDEMLEEQIVDFDDEDYETRFYIRYEPTTRAVIFSKRAEVFWENITHNLGRMAREAGIYEYLWRPNEIGITQAGQLLEPLEKGLKLLESDSERFSAFNPDNGWGDYDGLVSFTSHYLSACREYPKALISASR